MRKKLKIIVPLTILSVLVLILVNYFINSKNPDERDIGYIDPGLHPADVMIRFEREYKGLKYQDALNFTQEEYDSLTKKQILKMQDERFSNWIKVIEKPNNEE